MKLVLKISILFFALNILSCESFYSKNKSVYKIEDVTSKQQIILKSPEDLNPHSIYIKIKGKINGDLTLKISDSNKIIYTRNLEKGVVNKKLSSDWYSPTYVIDYIPHNISEGYLDIIYNYES